MKRRAAGLLLVIAISLGAAGCSSSDDSDGADKPDSSIEIDSTTPTAETSSVAYDYFGSAELAQGSTLETGVQGVSSVDDVTVTQTPAGVEATVTDGLDGTVRLRIEIADDAPLGAHAITFDIVGEPQPVDWTIDIISG